MITYLHNYASTAQLSKSITKANQEHSTTQSFDKKEAMLKSMMEKVSIRNKRIGFQIKLTNVSFLN